jgi:ParB family transcriptional regulator, chromosome partitioning protein
MTSKARRTLKQAYREDTSPGLERFVFGDNLDSSGQLLQESKEDEKIGVEMIVPIFKIHKTFSFTPDKKPVRYYYDIEELRHWAENDLKLNGVRSPLWTRPMPNIPGEYELVAGFRRLTACELVQISNIPIKVFDWNDAQAYAAAFEENDQRRNFSALEDLDITLNLLSTKLNRSREEIVSLLYRMDNAAKGKITQDVLGSQEAKTIDEFFKFRDFLTWQSFVAIRLPLLRKPAEILSAIRDSKIESSKALEIAKLKDPIQRMSLLRKAIAESLPLSVIKEQVKKILTDAKADDYNGEEKDLKRRFKVAVQRISKSKVWADQSKVSQLSNLLMSLESLVD